MSFHAYADYSGSVSQELPRRESTLQGMACPAPNAHTARHTMNARRCRRIARHMDKLLRRELGSPVDEERMLTDALYARDVLLVCDAMRDHDLAALALRFRRAMLADPDSPAGSARPSGFSASRFLSSLFGGLGGGADRPLPPAAPNAARDRSLQK